MNTTLDYFCLSFSFVTLKLYLLKIFSELSFDFLNQRCCAGELSYIYNSNSYLLWK